MSHSDKRPGADMSEATIIVLVPGVPRPGGSKTATVIRRKGGAIVMHNGRPLITMRDDAKGNADWKSAVAYCARQAYSGDPLHGPLRVQFDFIMPRPKGHYGTGRNAGVLKRTAPVLHTSKPDALKLARSTEDALSGIVWHDDNQTAHLIVHKRYPRPGETTGARITITPIEQEPQ